MSSATKIIISDSITKGGVAKSLPDNRLLNINQSTTSPSLPQKPKEKTAGSNKSQKQASKKAILLLEKMTKNMPSSLGI